MYHVVFKFNDDSDYREDTSNGTIIFSYTYVWEFLTIDRCKNIHTHKVKFNFLNIYMLRKLREFLRYFEQKKARIELKKSKTFLLPH